MIVLLSGFLPATHAQTSVEVSKKIGAAEIEAVLQREFGSNVTVHEGAPFYLLDDFNGDGFVDLAAMVNIEKAGADLKRHQVQFIDVDRGSRIDPLTHEFHNCLGLAIIHGRSAGWQAADPAGKFMIYECFSGFKLIRKGQRIPRGRASGGPTPKPPGGSVLLDLESGGTKLVYWKGTTYRSFYIRIGD
jgi:hypothetical protein